MTRNLDILLKNLECDEFYIGNQIPRLYAYDCSKKAFSHENGLFQPVDKENWSIKRIAKQRYIELYIGRLLTNG
jgi:hypothetical protein